MGKTELIKESLKKIIVMMVMVLFFVIGILAFYFSSLLIGHQESLKTTSDELIYVNHKSSGTGSSIVVENSESLRVQVLNPVSPKESVKGK